MDTIRLNNGIDMPLLGFGVFQVPDGAEAEQAVTDALNTGYRLIDTAAAYRNEESVGRAITKSGIPRSELFITTKLWVQDYGYETAKEAFELSLQKLGLDYIDLYLLHQPMGDYYSAYRALEDLYTEGKIRAIGVSNFYPHVLTDLCLHCRVIPAVNQVELHPFFQQEGALRTMRELGVVPEAWGPLGAGMQGIFDDPLITEIAAKHGKTSAQVILRWNMQRGVVVIPKSVHRERIAENWNVWDFSLDADDMERIGGLDKGHSELVDHFDPEFVRRVHSLQIHP